jgi:uncharacterized protein YbjT (DUF2867 family)
LRRNIFISGGTGYLGAALIPRLIAGGHGVKALVRRGSEGKLDPGCRNTIGNALDAFTFRDQVQSADTFVHLIGVSHPAPWKAEQFRAVDGVSLRASVDAACFAKVAHFIYVSVAHPAPVMQSYIEVRAACEAYIQSSGLSATILRPWYVLGPGHLWPSVLKPLYAMFERLSATRDGAQRLGLITLDEMVNALLWSIEHQAADTRVLEVPEIRSLPGAAP